MEQIFNIMRWIAMVIVVVFGVFWLRNSRKEFEFRVKAGLPLYYRGPIVPANADSLFK